MLSRVMQIFTVSLIVPAVALASGTAAAGEHLHLGQKVKHA
jgi:hypothetical protein